MAALLAASASASAQHGELPALQVTQYQLANGLGVILHEDHTTPTVCVNIWYHVGSKDEPKGRNGFAHLFEHLMFQGSKHVGEDQFFMYLERAGASDRNGTTSLDRTNYYETLPANQLELALWLESDRMGFLLDHVDQKTFESQRSVVLNERRQNYEDAPYGLVPKYIQEALYPPNHPYHELTIGSPEDLGAATLDDVRNFYKTYYVPNNARLVVAGDFQPASARGLIEKYFGPIPQAAKPKIATTPVPVALSAEVVIQAEAAVELPRVYVTYPTPPFFAPGDAQLDGLSQVLADGKTSRLYRRLVYDLQVAKDVYAFQASGQLASSFQIIATAKPGNTTQDLLKVIDEELANARSTDPTPAETNRAKANLEASLIFRIEELGERADMFNTYAQLAGSPDYFSRDVARYRTLTPEAIRAAAERWLPVDRRVVVHVTPNASALRAGQLIRTK
jgi:zinc protease